ncbi:acyltransferase family protein [Cohnella sp. JJ-181]|uniref:acyltransferase family protein n=1 Tax=Cohnella rhizoplanae TaxID=2974897 RepID=UPI0022FF96FA|nr:acyltransferase [Cohnella sp. JJ-181]CAI6083495.1 Serine/alanine racemase [Cohnella sp. JJ-181]
MSAKTDYSGLSWLKFAAALLVVANHTGPLASFSPLADFLVGGALTRIAVPIFFMTSGFFYFRKLTGDPASDRLRLRRYLGSIAKLYAIAILLYLPLNLYNGYFSASFGWPSLLRDLAFDGTFYHLWYLPALMIGIAMLHVMYRTMKPAAVMAVACGLYLVGLFGDSYYGFIAGSDVLTGGYDVLFHAFDYTRNGLFFAPVYLALGASVARKPQAASRPYAHAALFLASLAAMLAEALWLRAGEMPRHDSMYVLAVPAAYFLFLWALPYKGPANRGLREGRAWIYILHPLAIVLVRGAAKATGLQPWLIGNSLIHFAAVCGLSVALAAIAVRLPSLGTILSALRPNAKSAGSASTRRS